MQARRGTVWTIYESGPLIIFGEKCRTPRAARQARFFPILSGCLILVTTRHRQRLGDWICIGLTSAGYSLSSPYLSSPSHRSMEMPLDPGRAGLDRARFCAFCCGSRGAPPIAMVRSARALCDWVMACAGEPGLRACELRSSARPIATTRMVGTRTGQLVAPALRHCLPQRPTTIGRWDNAWCSACRWSRTHWSSGHRGLIVAGREQTIQG